MCVVGVSGNNASPHLRISITFPALAASTNWFTVITAILLFVSSVVLYICIPNVVLLWVLTILLKFELPKRYQEDYKQTIYMQKLSQARVLRLCKISTKFNADDLESEYRLTVMLNIHPMIGKTSWVHHPHQQTIVVRLQLLNKISTLIIQSHIAQHVTYHQPALHL
jgi:hypothetical protein